MQLFVPGLVALLATNAAAWQTVVYYGVADCTAQDDTTYRIFDADSPVYNQCINSVDPWADGAGITCQEYTQGGINPPTDCNHGLNYDPGQTVISMAVHPQTQAGAGKSLAFAQTWSSAGCNNDNQSPTDKGDQTYCITYGPGYGFLTSWAMMANGYIDG